MFGCTPIEAPFVTIPGRIIRSQIYINQELFHAVPGLFRRKRTGPEVAIPPDTYGLQGFFFFF